MLRVKTVLTREGWVHIGSESSVSGLREITRPLDLIMAAVGRKGTMKDFCSVTCLCSFKSKPTTAQADQNRQPPSSSSTAASSSLCSSCSNSCSVRETSFIFPLPAQRFLTPPLPVSDARRAEAGPDRPRLLQRRLSGNVLPGRCGSVRLLRLGLPPNAAGAEAGARHENLLWCRLPGGVQRGAETSDRNGFDPVSRRFTQLPSFPLVLQCFYEPVL